MIICKLLNNLQDKGKSSVRFSRHMVSTLNMAGVSKSRIALACSIILLILTPASANLPSGLTYMESTWSNNDAEDGGLIAINNDNTILASVHDNKVFLFDLSSKLNIASFTMERVSAMEFSPDGMTLAVNKDSIPGDDENIKMIDITSLTVSEIGAVSNDDSQDISWSSDSETLAIQSGESDVKLYNKSGLTIKRTLSGAHNTDVTCIDHSVDDIIITGDNLGRYLFWENSTKGDYRDYGEGLVDCMFAPNGEDVLLLGENGNIKSSTIEGSVKKAMNIVGAVKVLFSQSGNKIHVAVQSDDFRGLITYDYDTFVEEKRTSFFHNIEDIEIVEDEYSKLKEVYVAGGTGQIAIYLKRSIPDGYGEPGSDLDGDGVPDNLDNDDDGDGIIDADDDGVGCDAPDGIMCSKYPDLSKIRSINFDFGQDFTVTDTITFPTDLSSNIRNLSRISIGSDMALISQEVSLFEVSICANLDHEEIIEFWRESIMLTNGQLGNAEVKCSINSGMELVQSKDYFTQISFSIIVRFAYETEIELPVDISLPEYLPPTKGSISWVVPSYPIYFSFTGDGVETIEIPLWWNDDELSAITIDEKVVKEPTLIDKTLDWAYHPIAILFYLGVLAIGVLSLVRRENKITFDLDDDEIDVETNIEDSLEDEYEDEEIDDYSNDEDLEAPPVSKKRTMYSTSAEAKTLSTKKIRSSKKKPASNVVSKRKRLDDINIEPIIVKKKSVRTKIVNDNLTVRKVISSTSANTLPIKKKLVKGNETDVKTRKVKSVSNNDSTTTDKLIEDPQTESEKEATNDKLMDVSQTESLKEKKKKKRKPVKRKGKSTETKNIDEKEMQDNLVSDFLSDD